jgi:hypothetical protein
MSDEEMKAELERLRNENAALKKGAATGITMKVSEKGGLSIYGMGRFPVTLYKEQWLKLLDMSDDIRTFIAANEAQLKTKGEALSKGFRAVPAPPHGANLTAINKRGRNHANLAVMHALTTEFETLESAERASAYALDPLQVPGT